ncbi:MAG: molecular chaperone DjiA, partial [Polaribacter sp.]
MSSFSKWLGAGLGFTLGGPIGAAVGFALGSFVANFSTKEFEQEQINYTKSSGRNYIRKNNTQSGDFEMSLLVLA